MGGAPTWTQQFPGGATPLDRLLHTAVYDSANNRMIVFGGQNVIDVPSKTFQRLGDLWELSNANGLGGTPTWTQLPQLGTPPGPRASHRAVFDTANQRMIVFGGGNPFSEKRVWVLTLPQALFLLIDEDSIDTGFPPNFFSDVDINDQKADIGLREVLPAFDGANIGSTITLYTGEVGDEGWFALKTIPASWDAAGPTGDGSINYLLAGPGLGTEDADGDREALLDKIPDVTPLRATGLQLLEGQSVCAVVYDSDISINYDPLNGSLKGSNLGIVAFEVMTVLQRENRSSGSLPDVEIKILDASEVCAAPLTLFEDAPEPTSSSEPFDV